MSMFIKFFKALNANQHPGQIALSFVLGMILGLTPLLFPHNLLILLLVFLLRVNLSALLVAFVFFTGLAYLFDPLFDRFGYWLLHLQSLQTLWTDLYNQTLWQLLSFNNTIVIGSVVFSVLISVPAFYGFLVLVRLYRRRFLEWVQRFKLVRMLRGAEGANVIGGMLK
ncbi:TIGR03546 family protein [Hydrogenovibrio halophilus]|uniref:TIGR03546 family protein n=1 Tax=Hydrogenovibrio halophilus TaxID=373391 RepID=UPI00039CE1C5|nr:TIGR03546 family protein [Hydrogenovibrio halophilus]